jgi:predicted metal-dependent phosphotriesterase family hydrolase
MKTTDSSINPRGHVGRRTFIQNSAMSIAGLLLAPAAWRNTAPNAAKDYVLTVNGPIDADAMGFALTHEHIIADFIGAEKFSKDRYNAEEVFNTALPHLKALKETGCATFFAAEPAYLGRDVTILKRLSDATGLNILTNTGYYGAVNELFLPKHVQTETPEQLAARWIAEFKTGIEGTGIKPGFIKTSTDKGPLTKLQRKVITAACLTHLETGLTMLVHTGDGAAAKEQLAILKDVGVDPSARVWTHAQNETDEKQFVEAAKQNCWVAFDGVNTGSLDANLRRLQVMKSANVLDHVLVSHDSGWYHVGEPKGGNFGGFTCIAKEFIPKLKQNGFTDREIDQIFKTNPAKAFAIRVRKK